MPPPPPNIIALIPARGGSQGIPRKNLHPLCGKPLLAWTVETALACPSLQRVIVSTKDEMVAAAWVAQMEKLAELLQARDKISTWYNRGLQDLPGLTLVQVQPHTRPVCWLYSILVDAAAFGMGRDALMARLEAAGIDTRPLFIPLHQQPVYEAGLKLPICEDLAARGISLPSSPGLAEQDIARIVESIRQASKFNPG